MFKKTLAGGFVALALTVPTLAFAEGIDISSLNSSVTACLSPAPGTDPAVTQAACAALLQALIAIVAQLVANQPTPTPTPTPTPPAPSASTTAGTVTFSLDASSPSYGIAVAGSNGVTMGAYKIRATGESVNLRYVNLFLTSGNSANIRNVYLYSGSTLLGNGIFAGGGAQNSTITFSSPIRIPQDLDFQLTAKADLTSVGSGQAGVPGDLVKIDLVGASATGVTSGSNINGNGETHVEGVRIYKSYPTVALGSLPNDGVADGRLIRFSVTANASGYVGLGKLSFSMNSSGVNVSNIRLYAYTDSGYSSPSAQGVGGQVGATVASASSPLIFGPNTPIEIPAGQTYYFELRGDVAQTSSIPGSTAVKLLGDSAASGAILQSGTALREKDVSFVWSPNTLTTAGYADSDWVSAYAVPGLPSSGLIQSRGGSAPTPTVTVTGSASAASYRNGIDPMRFSYDVNNAPTGSAIQIDLIGSKIPGGKYPMVGSYLLDGTTRTLDLSQQQNTFPSHGTITFAINTSESYLPIEGPIQIKILNSSGQVIASTNIPVTVVTGSTPPPPPPPPTSTNNISIGVASQFAQGTPITATWQNLSGASSHDWIAVVRNGTNWTPSSDPISNRWIWAMSNSQTRPTTDGAPAGSISLSSSDLSAGQYQLVYYREVIAPTGNSNIELFRTPAFTIGNASVSFPTGNIRFVNQALNACIQAADTVYGLSVAPCDGSAIQAFRAESQGSGASRIVNSASGLCIDVAGGVHQATCSSASSQSFVLSAASYGFVHLVNTQTGACLSSGAASGSGYMLNLVVCNSDLSQSWSAQFANTLSSANQKAQLANALSALAGTLESLISYLGQH